MNHLTNAVGVDATDDGDEPLGEAPEVTIAQATTLIDRQAQALNAIRELHDNITLNPLATQECEDHDHDVFEDSGGQWVCGSCGPDLIVCETCRDVDGDCLDYPCPTRAILDRLGV